MASPLNPRRLGRFKPLETYYNGNRYDSRADARWGAFFDSFTGSRYTSASLTEDRAAFFHLPALDTFVIVRPTLPDDGDIRLVQRWVRHGLAEQAAIVFGRCWFPWRPDSYGSFLFFKNAANEYGWQRDALWRQCSECAYICMASDNEPCPNCGKRETLCNDTERLVRAYETAAGISFTNRNRA